ncbi:MAG: radical SAM protein [Nanoarchaeota archaeon]|nr:radical SAM protein [Nanoarchaeota archaeon]
MACKFCFAKFNGPPIPMPKIKKILTKLAKLKPKLLVFGGEPTLRNDLGEIFEYSISLGLKLAIDTNALLLHEPLLDFLRSKVVRIGLPLYGSKDIHDNMVGCKGHFNNVIKAIESCKKKKIPIKINTAVTKQNYFFLKNIAKIVDKYNIKLWTCLQFSPENRAVEYEELYSISDREYNNAIIKLKDNFPHLRIDAPSNKKQDGAYFIVAASGKVYSVSHKYKRDILIGNLNTESVEKILNRQKINQKRYEQRFKEGV